jgi:hypothetical protein
LCGYLDEDLNGQGSRKIWSGNHENQKIDFELGCRGGNGEMKWEENQMINEVACCA